MSRKARGFVLASASVGIVYLATATLSWRVSDPRLFVLYAVMAGVCSLFQVTVPGNSGASFSFNLPFVLLSIVQMSLPQSVIVGCVGGLVQALRDRRTRSKPGQIALNLGILAIVVATADFACHALIPPMLQNDTVLLLVAAVALFFANTFPSAILMRLNGSKRLGQIWKETYFWSLPYYLVAASVAKILKTAAGGLSIEFTLLVLMILYVAYRYYRVQKTHMAEREKYAGDMAALHLRAIEALALAVEAKDNLNTRGHLRRVQVYALGVGKELGLSKEELESLHAAALLHDIGKLAVPEHILTKPGKLTPEEFAKMKVHPLVGAEIVEQVQFPGAVAPIVRAHHEKWDGSGYPIGLRGEEIPLGARIITAVDCLDALSSDREYRRGLPLDAAMDQIVSESGKSFDPRVVEILKLRYKELDLLARSIEDRGAVLSTNVRVDKGAAPDAGLDLSAGGGLTPAKSPSDFLTTIAAARREGQMLFDLAQDVGSSLDIQTTLLRVEENLSPVIPFDAMAMFLREGEVLSVHYAAGQNKEMLSGLRVTMGDGLTGWVAQNGKPVVNGNPAVDAGFLCDPASPLLAALAMPIEGEAGLLGVLALYRRERDSFTRDDLRILANVAPKAGLAVENAMKFRVMEVRANTDGLTDLPNSTLLTQFLDTMLVRCRRDKERLCVTVCRLTGLPSPNSATGQSVVDQLVRSAARAMKDSCRQDDYIARIGDDRFALVFPGMGTHDIAGKIERLNAIVAASVHGVSGEGAVRMISAQAYYPDDADRAKPLLEIAESRLEHDVNASAGSLLALEAHTRRPVAETAPVQIRLRA